MLCRPGVAREHESWGAPIVYPRVRRIASVPRGSRLPFQVANIASAVSWRLAFWRSLMGLVNLKSFRFISCQHQITVARAAVGGTHRDAPLERGSVNVPIVLAVSRACAGRPTSASLSRVRAAWRA
jgi:hypothetical protein